MISILNNIFGKKSVTVALDTNVRLTVIPVTGGVNAVLSENTGIFTRTEKAFFASLSDLTRSLNLTDDAIVKKLAKAF
jgi:hypothetical protein